ncbi:hypothetical protein B0H17DRAFT_1334014 [Mycena rosella]|uniref:Uncharacterized protein n=1 Tax=Mycena rosella TaxID=1033263 RepID=A0AAD7D4Y6_MYCRO|nr:hypothetical protein B0H17DRAFT_1334014 [Mycena rosella]
MQGRIPGPGPSRLALHAQLHSVTRRRVSLRAASTDDHIVPQLRLHVDNHAAPDQTAPSIALSSAHTATHRPPPRLAHTSPLDGPHLTSTRRRASPRAAGRHHKHHRSTPATAPGPALHAHARPAGYIAARGPARLASPPAVSPSLNNQTKRTS